MHQRRDALEVLAAGSGAHAQQAIGFFVDQGVTLAAQLLQFWPVQHESKLSPRSPAQLPVTNDMQLE
jgi:hypothetical protein